MPSDRFEQKLSEKLQEARMVPSPRVWQAVEEQLAASPKKRTLVWWWWGGLFAIVCLLGGLWWSQLDRPFMDSAASLVSQAEQSTSATYDQSATASQAAQVSQALSVEDQAAHAAESDHLRSRSVHASHSTHLEIKRLPHQQVLISNSNLQRYSAPILPTSRREQGDGLSTLDAQMISLDHALPHSVAQPLDYEPKQPSRWGLRLSVQREMAGRGRLANFWTAPKHDHSLLETPTFSVSQTEGQVYTVRYPRQSTVVSVGVDYRLTRRWSLISGLSLFYSDTGFLQRGVALFPNITPGGTPAVEEVDEFNLELYWHQRQIEMPLALQVDVLQLGSHRVSVMSGVSMNRVWRTPIWSLDPSQTNEEQSAEIDPIYEPSNRSLVTGEAQQLLRFRGWHSHIDARVWYRFQSSRRWSLYTGPTAKYHLRGAYEGLAARAQMRYRLGWELGVRFGNWR